MMAVVGSCVSVLVADYFLATILFFLLKVVSIEDLEGTPWNIVLLFGGAIQMAGAVKAKRAGRYATSDWMAVEKERGISVTTSVRKFNYNGYKVNLLYMPGHQDFSEDT